MLESLTEETVGKLQMRLLLRKKGLTSLFKEARCFEGTFEFVSVIFCSAKTEQNRFSGFHQSR